MRLFFKRLLSVAISRYILLFFTLITSIYIARVLGPEKQGILVELLFLPQMIASLVSFNVPEQLLCYFSSKEKSLKFNARVVLYSLLSYFLVLIILFYFIFHDDLNILLFSIFFSFGILLNNVLVISGRALCLSKLIDIAFILQGLSLFTLVYFTLYLDYDYHNIIYCYLASVYIPVIFLSITYFDQVSTLKPGSDGYYSFFKEAFLGYLGKVSIIVESSFDRFYIMHKLESSQLGLYSVAQNLSQMVTLAIQLPLSATILPYLNSIDLGNRWRVALKVYFIIQFVAVVFTLVFYVISTEVVSIIYGEEYISILNSLNLLILAVCFRMPVVCLNYYLRSIFKSKEILKASLVSMPTNIILCLILIPKLEMEGAAISSLISYFIFAFITLLTFFKYKSNP